jgi:hypothetical protein
MLVVEEYDVLEIIMHDEATIELQSHMLMGPKKLEIKIHCDVDTTWGEVHDELIDTLGKADMYIIGSQGKRVMESEKVQPGPFKVMIRGRGGARRKRDVDNVQARESDHEVVRLLLTQFATAWNKDKWLHALTDPTVPDRVIDQMEANIRGGTMESKATRILDVMPSFVAIKETWCNGHPSRAILFYAHAKNQF